MNYSSIYLIPRYSSLRSRDDANISVNFLGRDFKAPWVPANMESVIDANIAGWLSENDYFYIMHRFHDTLNFVQQANEKNWKTISISIGVKEEDILLLGLISSKKLRVDFITIDIAHGHCIKMREMLEYIKDLVFLRNTSYLIEDEDGPVDHAVFTEEYRPKIIAGNVATTEGVQDLADWGANAVKVGIAGGAACSTKHQTGFHVPMFSCVQSCLSPKTIPLIADGGIRENGDIPKALVAGANMVMAGSLFAACSNAPGGDIFETVGCMETGYRKGRLVSKRYHGSASSRQKGHSKNVEGIETELPCNGLTYKEKYEELTDSLKSALSYAGGRNLSAFQTVKFLEKR